MNSIHQAKFRIGQIVEHKLFNYRGLVYEVDPVFSLTPEWYDQVARSRPPKDKPWYHLLVDQGEHSTYVAERHLMASHDFSEIRHPAVSNFFSDFKDGYYLPKHPLM